MGIFTKLLKRKKKTKSPSTTSHVQVKNERSTQTNLLEYFDKAEGTDELYEMLRSYPVSKIEDVCKTFPVETLRLDWNSIQSDFRNNKRFELITILAQILVLYEQILEQSPELRLPRSLPAKHLSDILMSRLIPFIKRQENIEIAHGLRIRLYEFAMALIQTERNSDALSCLLVSKPSIKEDHDFWICACKHNIALTTKSSDNITDAIYTAEQIINEHVKVPDKYIEGVRNMLNNLKRLV